jgi:glycerate kinase
LNNCRFTTLHDVKNPLCGKHGAAAVFAEQKGASPDAIQLLDLGLAHFANVVLKQFKLDVNFPGAGAGGGIAAMAKLALNSSFIPGIDFILDFTHLEHYLQNASLVITGEGKIDEQTLSGKVVKGVATFCAKYNKPCIAFTGTSTITHDQTKRLGLQEIIALVDAATSEPEAVREAYSILKLKAVRSLPRWLT